MSNLARDRDGPLKPSLIALIERRYDAILAEGLVFHEAQAPLGQPVKGGGKRRGRRLAEPDTISSRAFQRENTMCCASFMMRVFHSPTTRPNATAHDEAAAEDLWWLPLRARRRRFRSDPLAPLHSQEARLGPSLNVDHRPPAPDRHASAGLNPACDTLG